MSFSQAGEIFTKLTIGDGLVSQVPALLDFACRWFAGHPIEHRYEFAKRISTAIVFAPPSAGVAGGFLAMLVFTNLPTIPLVTIGGSCIGMAVMLNRQKQREAAVAATKTKEDAKKKPDERIEDFLTTDPMEIEIGVGLIRLADPKRGGDLLERIERVRQSVAADIGMIMPKVRIRDNMRLEQTQYRVKIADIPVSEGVLEPGLLLAIDSGATTGKVRGI